MQRLLCVFFLLATTQCVFAASSAQVLSMRIEPGSELTRIVFAITKKPTGTVKYLPNPDRVVLEFINTSKRFNIQNAKLIGANVEEINTKEFANGSLQFIFRTKGRVKWTTTFLSDDNQRHILFQIEIISFNSNQVLKNKPAASTTHVISAKIPRRKFTIAIDAGHGGKDSGACGITGIQEKHVVLSIAKKLAAKINKTHHLRAILTRHGDYYVSLRERLRLARKDKADVFIAIHADAYFNSKATGISVYALSQRGASSEAARWLAQRDNYSELGGIKLDALPDRSSMVQSVLIDLAQTATIRDSIRLGNKLLDALDDISSLHYSQVEQAPFLVLKSPDIPSVLVETGFISNPVEERLLAEEAYQEELAHALYQGIQKYVKKYASQVD